MAIEKLDNAAVRVIGASQVLTDSATVVKELIDNALDAHATSIAVDIHHNTLDVIQVRDNGHGIAPEDRAMVAIPNCTSKLVNIDDLKSVAGVSLGFRGQALAAAAELSGSMTVSTRIEGETVATALKVNQRGEVVGKERVSLPVGTTVRITEFIKANPVRRQVAMKNTEKCLKKIKQTLQAYAFARLHVRFSLKVLKVKDQKFNWMYPPKPGGSVDDAAIKIIGSACVSQCTWSIIEESGFTLQAFIPRPDAEVVKVSGIGSFISIDGRPVSASRGTLKQIVKIFRDSLRAANPAFDGVKEPFIYMRIICPAASYDPNVEPAKDDVLFEDPDVIVDAARRLFAAVYPSKSIESDGGPRRQPELARPAHQSSPPPSNRAPEDDTYQENDLVMPQRALINLDEEPSHGQLTAVANHELSDDGEDAAHHATPPQVFRSNMYGCDEEDLDMLDARPSTGRTEQDLAELRQVSKDVTMSNPWVMAKLNASVRRPPPDVPAVLSSSPIRQARPSDMLLSQSGLPTPRPSSPSPPAVGTYSADDVLNIHAHAGGRIRDDLDRLTPNARLREPSPLLRGRHDGAMTDNDSRQYPAHNYASASDANEAPAGTPLHAIPNANQRPRRSPPKHAQGRVNKPFVSPMIDQPTREKVWFDHLEDRGRPKAKARRPYQNHNSDGLVQQGELGDLMDETRALTPPRRNRDIREFVDSVDLTGGESASSMVERRIYGRQDSRRTRSASAGVSRHPLSGDENSSPVKNLLSGRGFVPASELAALEERFGALDKQPARPPKRRKTGEGVLREISSNLNSRSQLRAEDDNDAADDQSVAPKPARRAEDDEHYDIPERRTTSRRHRATGDGTSRKVTRTKSSRLPLERIPKGAGMHDIEFKLSVSLHAVSSWAGKIDEGHSLLAYNEPALNACDAFANPPTDHEIVEMSKRLEGLLTSKVSDGELVQDLASLTRDAFAARARGEVEAGMYADIVE